MGGPKLGWLKMLKKSARACGAYAAKGLDEGGTGFSLS